MIDKLIQLADTLDELGFVKDADELDQFVAKIADMPVLVDKRLTQVPEQFEVIAPIVNAADEDVMEAFEDEPEKPAERPHVVGRITKAIYEYKQRFFQLIREKGRELSDEDIEALDDQISDEFNLTPQEEDMVGAEVMAWVEQNMNAADDKEEKKEPPMNKDTRLELIKRRHELMKLRKLLEMLGPKQRHEAYLDQQMKYADEENDADDGIADQLKSMLKDVPEIVMKVLKIVKDNPELLALLAV